MTVMSAPPQRESACAYTIQSLVAQFSPYAAPYRRSGAERKLVTRAGEWIAGSNGADVKKQFHKKEPSNMVCIRKSKACQTKRMRRLVGALRSRARRESI